MAIPRARTTDEIVFCYPGFEAITIYRIAHQLVQLDVPFIPRMMTEWAHQQTGIDIHPGATIGDYFFIDHGTGVVVGETCEIGEHVKLYQGVTLGALSFPTDADGQIIRGQKRHPTIEDHVVVMPTRPSSVAALWLDVIRSSARVSGLPVAFLPERPCCSKNLNCVFVVETTLATNWRPN